MIPDWTGQRCFVVGCGSSLTLDDCEKLRGENVIAVNRAVLYLPFAQILYACDHKWWHVYRDDWKDFAGLKCSIDRTVRSEFPDIVDFTYHQKEILSKDPARLASGGNSAHQAANLAFHAGANRIYILGLDMSAKPDKIHFHEDHDTKKSFHLPGSKHLHRLNNPSPILFQQWRENFYNLYIAMKKEGVDLINVSRESALNIPKMDFDAIL